MGAEFPSALQIGIDQFNRGEFYACHDTLESLWMEAPESTRNFYQGILQIAVALHHLSNCNWQGAVILLGEGIRRLQPYQPNYFGVQVSPLIDQSLELLTTLQQLGPEQVELCARKLGLIAPPNTPENQVDAAADSAIFSLQVPQIFQVE